MTIRQRILKIFYPALMQIKSNASTNIINTKNIKPVNSFYNLNCTLNTGKEFLFNNLKGYNVLIVNTASNCGFTNQYEELEKLYKQHNANLIILGFPANDFKNQETGTDDEIAQFCKVNFGVSFPLMQKSSVVKSNTQNPVFNWLSNPNLDGWNNQEPTWNFCKYFINKQGVLTHFFPSCISPMSKEITKLIK